MLVVLEANWFAPNGSRYRKSVDGRPVYIPDEFRDVLPKRAVVVENDEDVFEPAPEPTEHLVLRDFDETRQNGDVLVKTIEKAEAFRAEQEQAQVIKRGRGRPRKEKAA